MNRSKSTLTRRGAIGNPNARPSEFKPRLVHCEQHAPPVKAARRKTDAACILGYAIPRVKIEGIRVDVDGDVVWISVEVKRATGTS